MKGYQRTVGAGEIDLFPPWVQAESVRFPEMNLAVTFDGGEA
jgi:hypothetical protein